MTIIELAELAEIDLTENPINDFSVWVLDNMVVCMHNLKDYAITIYLN